MITWLTLRTVIGIWLVLGFIGFFIRYEKVSVLFVDAWNDFGFMRGIVVTILTLIAIYALILLSAIVPAFIIWFFFGV